MNHHDAVLERLRAVNPVPDEQSPPSGAIEAAFVKTQLDRELAASVPDHPARLVRAHWRRPLAAAAAAFLVVLLVGGVVALTQQGGGGGEPVPPASDVPQTSIELGAGEAQAAVATALRSIEQALSPDWVAEIQDRPARGIVDFDVCYRLPELGIDADPSLDLADLDALLAASAMAVVTGPDHAVGGAGSYSPIVTVEALAFAEETQAIRVEAALGELVGVGRHRICLAAVAFPDFGDAVAPWQVDLDEPPSAALPIDGADSAMSLGATLADGPFAGEPAAGALAVRRDGNLVYVVTWRDITDAVDRRIIEAVVAAP